MAERAFMEYKPLLDELERIQRDAGVDADEVVNMQRGRGTGTESRHRR